RAGKHPAPQGRRKTTRRAPVTRPGRGRGSYSPPDELVRPAKPYIRRMAKMVYRAAYWTDGRGAEIVLTLPEHSDMSDEELIAEARRYVVDVGLDISNGEIVVGEWME